MRIDCPRCRHTLEFSGDRPLFCAFCGIALSHDPAAPTVVSEGRPSTDAGSDLDLGRTAWVESLSETVEYRSILLEHQTRSRIEDYPREVAGYRLLRRLGSGGMGTVFEAEDESNGRHVAVKLIARDYAGSPEAVQRFRQEGRLASAVTHPRCVFVLAVDEDRGRPYIVMELMPGTTLQSLVEQQGPLDPPDAITRILDVIEGLQAFHKRGLIHRDVKPSNCFLDGEGRVKIGDFGLSKSLEGGAELTRTGTFIGTPLYASPEQIKREPVDQRTDVYSVAATLYYLLTGRPPVAAKDAAEALARIVSEPPPPLRKFRPSVPRALEGVILRGLEREPSRRWRTLQDFADALLPFLPERLTMGGIGLRIVAYSIDVGVSFLASWAIFGLAMLYHDWNVMQTVRFYESNLAAFGWGERALWIFYLAIFEGLAGATLGKWIAGLRVCRTAGGGPPGLLRGLARALAFYGITELPSNLLHHLAGPVTGPRGVLKLLAYDKGIRALGLILVVSTMRRRSGFRGPHEWLSGTRVVRVSGLRRGTSPRLRPVADSRLDSNPPFPAQGLPEEIGPFRVQGVLHSAHQRQLLLGEDSALQRPVWLILRPPSSPPPPPPRRALNRLTRLRWIAGGDHLWGRWDAYTAPSGLPLIEFVNGGRLAWRDALPVLEELVDELTSARLDGTLPSRLSLSQLWVRADGGIQLVEELEEEPSAEPPHNVSLECPEDHPNSHGNPTLPQTPSNDQQILGYLCNVARLMLEGPERTARRREQADVDQRHQDVSDAASSPGGEPRAKSRRIRAPVPERGRFILERLAGLRTPYSSLGDIKEDLRAAAASPTEVGTSLRGLQLAVQGFFLTPGLFLMYFLSSFQIRPRAFPWDVELVIAIPLIWILWAILVHGGLSFALAGISIVQSEGNPASGLRCGLRAAMVWIPLTSILVASRYLQETSPESIAVASWLWNFGLALLPTYLGLGLLMPARGLHDRIAGTVLVPS